MTDLIDSGIFIRHLTGDHPQHSPLATAVINDIALGRREGYTTAVALAEIIYVLTSPNLPYKVSREDMRTHLLPLIMLGHLHIDHKHVFNDVFDHYVNTSADFVDCYHAVLAKALGHGKVVSFDAHYRRLGVPYGCP